MDSSIKLPLSYRADIDGLRAIAVVPVCLFHAGIGGFSGGFVGVDVFFVISGYLMASLIGRDLAAGRFSIKSFYERRARRILPALFAMLGASALAAAFLIPPKLFRDFGATLIATVLFASNIIFWRKQANYFDVGTDWSPLVHAWSLGIEEQFYILFPLLLVLTWRFGRRVQVRWILLIAAASWLLCVWATSNAPTAAFYLLPTRAWELLLGSVVALGADSGMLLRFGRQSVFRRALWASAGLLMVLLSLARFDAEMPFPGTRAALPCAGAALLLLAGASGQETAVGRLLSSTPLTFVGKISYSLYLWHWPLIVFLEKYAGIDEITTAGRALIVAASVGIAWLSWRWVEQTFRGSGSAFSRRHALRLAAAGATMLAAAGAFAMSSAGWPSRFPGIEAVSLELQIRDESSDDRWTRFDERGCFVDHASEWKEGDCFLTRGARENALLWGDSFAASYAYGLFGNSAWSVNLLEYTSRQCPPISGYRSASRPQCSEFNNKVPDIIRRYNVSTVIMVANWGAYIKRHKLRLTDIAATVDLLHRVPVRVLLVGQGPVFPFAYPDEYFFAHFAERSNHAYYAPVDVDLGVNQRMKSLVHPDSFFDPLALWCSDAGCIFKEGSHYLYLDNGHYTHYGSRIAAAALLEKANAFGATALVRPASAP